MRDPWPNAVEGETYTEKTRAHLHTLEQTRPMRRVLDDVAQERFRQTEKWGVQANSAGVWSLVLIGKVGEACRAALENLVATDSESWRKQRVRDELVQVAAVTVAWIENIDREDAR